MCASHVKVVSARWWCILILCSGRVLGSCVLDMRFDSVFQRAVVLVFCFVFWSFVLVLCFGIVLGSSAMVLCFGPVLAFLV